MKNPEIEVLKEEQFQRDKNRLFNSSVEMYRSGYPIAVIINILYSGYHSCNKKFSKSAVHDFVYTAIYDFLMKEKQQQGN